ncbi:hypothetical protein GS399_17660 [Pedobacter sp. HMF7647]|uniref:Uncharacterized protein n=1 Tax=Hufsiella arboris TaxID=2695275 RepID=A0A7K1YDZ2_9SPHI|nr:hypothetical protein [Hufsiella arboris]MXV52802.1 hypothetical protein [Hufsiella arboris]
METHKGSAVDIADYKSAFKCAKIANLGKHKYLLDAHQVCNPDIESGFLIRPYRVSLSIHKKALS